MANIFTNLTFPNGNLLYFLSWYCYLVLECFHQSEFFKKNISFDFLLTCHSLKHDIFSMNAFILQNLYFMGIISYYYCLFEFSGCTPLFRKVGIL